MTRRRCIPALVALAACKPIFYDVDDAGDITTTHGTDSSPTDHHPSSPSDPDVPESCFDGDPDGDETDLDCGGACPPCEPGLQCKDPSDCASGLCTAGLCTPSTCHDDDECSLAAPPDLPCMRGVCDPGGACVVVPAFEGEPCEDQDPCTDKSACTQGKCFGVPRTCDELTDECRTGFCNPNTGVCAVEFTADGSKCDDGLDCSQFSSCDQGACVAQQPPDAFLETFSTDQGWQLDTPWQIGPATPSFCGDPGVDDPPFDHSDGDDSLLAGFVIGGCTPPDKFTPSCLTSPPIFKLEPGSPNVLRYFSWLSNAGTPMQARVDLFDGMQWTTLLVHDTFVAEQAWTEHILAIPQDMMLPPFIQVRFCQTQMDVSMKQVGGWSIDDVSLGPPQCGP